jgi:hypothetical protein
MVGGGVEHPSIFPGTTSKMQAAPDPIRTMQAAEKDKIAALRAKHPGRIPVMVHPMNDSVSSTDKTKFLFPEESPFSHVQVVVRQRLTAPLASGDALFFFVKGDDGRDELLMSSATLATLHAQHAGPDGALHVHYAKENTFGHLRLT